MTKPSFISSLFDKNALSLRKYEKHAKVVESFKEKMSSWSDEDLKKRFNEIKSNVSASVLSPNFASELIALGCLASKRVLGLDPYFVQIVGSLVLLDSKIAEMKTGEGKTLTAALTVLAKSTEGKGVHVVTVNDYLASRDAESMGRIYNFFGQSVHVVHQDLDKEEKRKAYHGDIIYSTNAEIGFDYLKNNLALNQDEMVMRDLHFAIVDEVDSILIDEARTPLIISSISDEAQEIAIKLDAVVKKLSPSDSEHGEGDFWPDEKHKQVIMSESGMIKSEELFISHGLLDKDDSVYAPQNITLIYYMEAALKAHYLYKKDIDYIVENREVLIIDTFTGRVMDGRRWGEGIHQAIEIKEGVDIKPETQTSASITLQNLFRNYNELSGMTGTAKTEEGEFREIYGLDVICIPTNKPMIRKDHPDMVFLTKDGKNKKMIENIQSIHKTGQPILIGTSSIESSEKYSQLLSSNNINHNVLNAKQHEKEAQIIAQAGKKGAITIATNMAGRGTDIILGGSKDHLSSMSDEIKSLSHDLSFMKPGSKVHTDLENKINFIKKEYEASKKSWQEEHDEIIALGGLYIIGTSRHESRRIDNQLRGRAARQGDPGSSVFYVSFEDSLLRIFAPAWATTTLRNMGMGDEDAISLPMVSKQIEKAQKTVEAHNFNARKSLLDYDNISNEQRLAYYNWRSEILDSTDIHEKIINTLSEAISLKIKNIYEASFFDQDNSEQKDGDGLIKSIQSSLSEYNLGYLDFSNINSSSSSTAFEDILSTIKKWIDERKSVNPQNWPEIEKAIFLTAADKNWREHLVLLEQLRKGIHLRGFAQKQPKQEYKREAFLLFESLVQKIDEDLIRGFITVLSKEKIELEELFSISPKSIEKVNIQSPKSHKAQSNHSSLNALKDSRWNKDYSVKFTDSLVKIDYSFKNSKISYTYKHMQPFWSKDV